jgi:hypothetical protein
MRMTRLGLLSLVPEISTGMGLMTLSLVSLVPMGVMVNRILSVLAVIRMWCLGTPCLALQ